MTKNRTICLIALYRAHQRTQAYLFLQCSQYSFFFVSFVSNFEVKLPLYFTSKFDFSRQNSGTYTATPQAEINPARGHVSCQKYFSIANRIFTHRDQRPLVLFISLPTGYWHRLDHKRYLPQSLFLLGAKS